MEIKTSGDDEDGSPRVVYLTGGVCRALSSKVLPWFSDDMDILACRSISSLLNALLLNGTAHCVRSCLVCTQYLDSVDVNDDIVIN